MTIALSISNLQKTPQQLCRHGFVADGDVFIGDNIKHIKMTRTLLPTAHEKKLS